MNNSQSRLFPANWPIGQRHNTLQKNLDHLDLYYLTLQVACFNDIHCNFGVRHLEYLLQVYIDL